MDKDTIQQAMAGREQRNLLLACQKVNNCWMPVSSQALENVKSGLKDGSYDLCIDFLINDLRTDIGLFTFCLKEIKKKFKERRMFLPEGLSPSELLETAGVEVLKEILDIEASQISPHELIEENHLQMQRLREMLVSASTAEVLSKKVGVDPDLGFTTEIIRQLGLCLIAWNYPTIYQRSMEKLKDGADLDHELRLALGFSPRLLAITIARQWNLCDELRAAIGDQQAAETLESSEAEQIASTLKQLCEIGEALARANDPDTYPSARQDWKTAADQIAEYLGSDGLQIIQEAVNKNCELYQSIAPTAFELAADLQREPQLSQLRENSLYFENKHIKSCPIEIQQALGEIYQRFVPGQVSKELLRELVNKVIPMAGFPKGCVLLLEPETAQLTPRLAIGEAALKDFHPRNTKQVSSNPNSDPIEEAYKSASPIIESERHKTVYGGACISALIGRSRRVGVLYLEMSKEILSNKAASPLICFKALLHTLNDLLLMK